MRKKRLFDMTPLQLAQCLMEAEYKYASTDIKPTAEMADFIYEWNQLNIPEDVLHKDEDGGKGRERDPHVTVKYGLIADDVPDALREIAKDTAPFPVFLGVVSLFTTNPEFDVVKLDVESPVLHELNRRVSEAVPHEDTYPEYHPHLTLAYVQKGSCEHLVGEDPFKAKGVTREFIASGMNFSGAGDDNDAGRVKESLLFSKVKKAKEAALAEAALQPAVEDVEAVIQQIENVRRQTQNPDEFMAAANEALLDYGVQFVRPDPKDPMSYGPHASDEGIFLPMPTEWDLKDPRWARSLYGLLHHEGVHIMQMDRSTKPSEMFTKAKEYVMPGGKFDEDRYLQQKQEIMAWASSLVDSWRRQGLTSEQMMRRLRTGNWGFGLKYWHARQQFPKTFNRFVKQATEYIEALRESTFAEAVTSLDPFAQCSFPADPDRIKQFLRGGGRRRVERTIL